ncbi:MAG: hypothetical protein ACP5I1_12580, partial [Candidatus Hinthialibacter sp.]
IFIVALPPDIFTVAKHKPCDWIDIHDEKKYDLLVRPRIGGYFFAPTFSQTGSKSLNTKKMRKFLREGSVSWVKAFSNA